MWNTLQKVSHRRTRKLEYLSTRSSQSSDPVATEGSWTETSHSCYQSTSRLQGASESKETSGEPMDAMRMRGMKVCDDIP